MAKQFKRFIIVLGNLNSSLFLPRMGTGEFNFVIFDLGCFEGF